MDFKEIDFKHKISAHCENGVTSNLLNYYGLQLSEPMVFGIGAGLFFTYLPFVKLNGAPVTSFRPMPGAIFKRINKSLGIKTISKRFSSNPKQSMEELDRLLSKGVPVGMVVGVYNLTYFPAPLRFHFNAHNIVAYRKENNNYLVSDPIMENPEWISAKDLELVRYAKGTYKPKGKLYHIEYVPKEIDIKKAIKRSIKYNSIMMVKAPGPVIGISGMRLLARSIAKWPKKYDSKRAARNLGSVIRMQEEIGTGGAGFRFLYAAFLQEASSIFDSKELSNLSAEMTVIGDKWRQFAVNSGRVVKNRPQNNESYDSVSKELMEIANLEEDLFKRLFKIKL
jgi:hypothetical protein